MQGDPSIPVAPFLVRVLVLGAPCLVALLLSTCRPPVSAGKPRFDAARAAATVSALTRGCAERRPRSACSRRALRIVSDALAASGTRVEAQAFGARGERVNVFGVRRGRRGAEVVLAAHHDTVPGSPGALDDAAGVAVVLEVARLLGRRADGASLRFAIFDGEEDGLLGSRAYVGGLLRARARLPRAAVSVEMPGARGGAPVLHGFSPAPPPASVVAREVTAAHAVGADLALSDPWISIPAQVLLRTVRVPFASDHTPFAVAGVPATMVSDASFSRFYAHYHADTDVPAQLDVRALAHTGRATLAIVHDLAFGAAVPTTGSREGLALGSRVARGAAFWGAALLALLPLVGSARRLRAGGLGLCALGAAGATLLEPTVAFAMLGVGLVLAPLAAGPPRLARVARAVSLAPAVVTSLVWVVACVRFGWLPPTLGAGPLGLVGVALAGLALLRPARPR